MNLRITLILITAFCINLSYGQSSENKFKSKDYIVFELGGHGGIYSINYERLLLNKDVFKTSVQAGFSYFYFPEKEKNVTQNSKDVVLSQHTVTIPIKINQLISFNSNHIELGIGVEYYMDYAKDSPNGMNHWFGILSQLGYRYQNPNKPYFYKSAFTPIYLLNRDEYVFIPMIMIGVGYQFGVK